MYEKYYDFPIKKFKYPYACNQSQYAELFKLYDYIFRRVYYVKINPKKLKKSFDTFLFLQRYFLDKFSYRSRFFYALEKVTFSPHIVSFMFMRDVPNPKFENYSRQNIGGVNNNIYELCEKSIKLSVSLIKDFYKSLSNKTPLNKQKFSTDFNIGKIDKQRT